MKIDYVVSTMVFWWREHHLSLELECDFLKSLGYGIEIWPSIRGHSECRFNERNWPRLKDATNGMKVLLHGRVDGPTIEEWREQIGCAKMLNAPITTHLESLCVSDTLDVADWNFAKEVVNIAKNEGVILCVESGKPKTILEVGQKFDYVWYCFNTGHAYLDRKSDFKTYVDLLAARTKVVHLTDNFRDLDEHQPPGTAGGIPRENWKYLLDSLEKYDNDVIGSFEMFPSMPEVLIKKASDFIFDDVKWPNKPTKSPDFKDHHYRPF
jgi:sugar phosphate isomerase/epimerase